MRNAVLILNLLLLTTHATYTMDPAPRKISRERRLRQLSSLHRTSSSAKLSNTYQDTSHATIPNPAICITPQQPSTDPIQLQRTISSLLRNSEGHEEPQSLSPESYFEPEKNLKTPLLHHVPKKSVPRLLLKSTEKSSSWSESPTTSPRKKSSPSQHSHKKLTSSSPYGSPRDTKSSHSSPRELVTYDIVMKAFTQKSKITNTVKAFLQNNANNPNQQDKDTGLTILQRAVLLHHEKAIDLILSDPRTDSFKEDNNLRKASDFIIGDEIIKFEKLFIALKKREFVDLIINALMITNKILQDPYCPQEFMRKVINTFLEKTLPKTLPKYSDSNFFIAAIRYRQDDQLSLLKNFHKQFKKNPSYQDKLGNTMWHYAAIVLDEVLIKRLVCNPYLDSSIRNKENFIAAQLIPSSNSIKTKHLNDTIILKIQYLKRLRTLLFTRDSLEFLCAKEAPMIRKLICPDISAFTLHKKIDKKTNQKQAELNPDFIQARKVIEDGFEIIARRQGDSALPEGTEFPPYATDEFIYEKLKIKMEAKDPLIESTALMLEKLLEEFKKELEELEAFKKKSELILSRKTKLDHIVIEKKPEPKKDQDTTSQPINDQDPLVSKSSED